MPNFDFFDKFPLDPLSKQCLLPIEAIVITRSNPTEFMHDEYDPSPCPPCLDTVPEFVLDWFTSIQEAKWALFGNRGWSNFGPPLIDCHNLMPNGPHECSFFTGAERVPHLGPIEPVIGREVTLPFFRRARNSRVLTTKYLSAKLCGVIKKLVPIGPVTSRGPNPG